MSCGHQDASTAAQNHRPATNSTSSLYPYPLSCARDVLRRSGSISCSSSSSFVDLRPGTWFQGGRDDSREQGTTSILALLTYRMPEIRMNYNNNNRWGLSNDARAANGNKMSQVSTLGIPRV